MRPGPQACERTDHGSLIDARAVNHGIRLHVHIVAEDRIPNKTVGSDANALAQDHFALKHGIDIDGAIRPRLESAAQVEPRRIPQRHAFPHECFRTPPLITPLGRRKLYPVIHTRKVFE